VASHSLRRLEEVLEEALEEVLEEETSRRGETEGGKEETEGGKGAPEAGTRPEGAIAPGEAVVPRQGAPSASQEDQHLLSY